MSPRPGSASVRWFCCGDDFFSTLLAALDAARTSIRLEIYMFVAGEPGDSVRAALIRAQQRGVRVRVLVDAVGSYELPRGYMDPLILAGAEVCTFNPLSWNRISIRDHRKIIVCDDCTAFLGGFNIAPEYAGDGVTHGWRDLGLQVTGAVVEQLARSVDEMVTRAAFRHKSFARLRQSGAKKSLPGPDAQLLLSGPGRGINPLKRALRGDLKKAREVRIMVAYFLPSWRLRRQLVSVVTRGGRVQLILAGKSDVRLSQLAGRCLYERLMKAGVEIFEYQPQVLHAKLVLLDDAVYAGSANLDQRSMQINYELMIRFQDRGIAGQAQAMFDETLKHCLRIDPVAWRRSRTWGQRLFQMLSWWILVRLDPWLARRQWRALPRRDGQRVSAAT